MNQLKNQTEIFQRNFIFRPPKRKPTSSWSWEKKTTTSTTESHVYYPQSSSTTNNYGLNKGQDIELAELKDGKPTRPTRPPKPSSIDLVTYFPPKLEKVTTTTSTTTKSTTTTRRTTPSTTRRTTVTTTRKTTARTTKKSATTTIKPLQSIITKRPQQPRHGGCGLPQRSGSCPKGRIVNGTQSCYGQFPWQVILMANYNLGTMQSTFVCTQSISFVLHRVLNRKSSGDIFWREKIHNT